MSKSETNAINNTSATDKQQISGNVSELPGTDLSKVTGGLVVIAPAAAALAAWDQLAGSFLRWFNEHNP